MIAIDQQPYVYIQICTLLPKEVKLPKKSFPVGVSLAEIVVAILLNIRTL